MDICLTGIFEKSNLTGIAFRAVMTGENESRLQFACIFKVLSVMYRNSNQSHYEELGKV